MCIWVNAWAHVVFCNNLNLLWEHWTVVDRCCWRINKVFSIRLSHFSWAKDCLRVQLFSSKSDPTGMNQHFVHLYHNPEHPEFDIYSTLFRYLQLHPEVLDKGTWLFLPGEGSTSKLRTVFTEEMSEKQKSEANSLETGWFKKQLDQVFATDMRAWLRNRNYDTSDVTAHSWRKLSKTFFTSESVADVSNDAVEIRMCHTGLIRRTGSRSGLQGTNGVYSNYSEMADRLLGRIASRSPYMLGKFITCPPHFQMRDNAIDPAVYAHSAAVWKPAEASSLSSGRHSTWSHKEYILTFLTAAFRHHAANGRFDESVLTYLKEVGCIRYFSHEAEALEKDLPPIICTSDPDAVPYMSLTGMDKQMHLARTMRIQVQEHLEKAFDGFANRQRDEAFAKIDDALAQIPKVIHSAIVRLLCVDSICGPPSLYFSIG